MGRLAQYVTSVAFIGQMYLVMFLMALFFTPLSVLDRENAIWAVHTYCRWVRWTAGWMLGLRSEVRGVVPEGGVLVCAKHQSFFDIILLVSVLPYPRFIMKAELRYAPIVGYFARRIGCVPVNRGRKGAAIRQMVAGVRALSDWPGQLLIYPQGTRVAPGVRRPYKIGSGILYENLGQDCVPAATNVGVFWPRHGIYRRPGLAVVEFLPVIPAGLSVEAFMAKLEDEVEACSDRLMAEAGFDVENARWT